MKRTFKYGYPNCIEEFLIFYEEDSLDNTDSIEKLDLHVEKLLEFFVSEYLRIFKTKKYPSYDYIQENIFQFTCQK